MHVNQSGVENKVLQRQRRYGEQHCTVCQRFFRAIMSLLLCLVCLSGNLIWNRVTWTWTERGLQQSLDFERVDCNKVWACPNCWSDPCLEDCSSWAQRCAFGLDGQPGLFIIELRWIVRPVKPSMSLKVSRAFVIYFFILGSMAAPSERKEWEKCAAQCQANW